MADTTTKAPPSQPLVNIPGLQAVPVVAVRLPDGTIALRHPSELQKVIPPTPAKGGA